MLTLATLIENISPDYLYPYGTELTLDHLQTLGTPAAPHYRIETTSPSGPCTYELKANHTGEGSFRNGSYWDFTNFSGMRFEGDLIDAEVISSPLVQAIWFDAVLQEDATTRLDAANAANPNYSHARYGGKDLESTLERVEKNIVEYSEDYLDYGFFYPREGISGWLKQQAPRQVLGWDYYALAEQDLQAVLGRDYILLQNFNTTADHPVGNPKVTYLPHGYRPGMEPEDFLTYYSREGNPLTLTSYMGFRLDGTEITDFNSAGVLSFELVEPLLRPVDPEDVPVGTWLVVHVPGLPMALLLPPSGAVLHLYTDEDGAMTVLEVLEQEEALFEQTRNAMFERRWGKYLDENQPLSDADCAEDIAILHARIQEGRPE